MDERPVRGERVIVVGAGLAGLACAFQLRRQGAEVVVLEREDRVGGRVKTVSRDGYRLDLGASFLMTSYETIRSLIASAGLTGRIQPTPSTMGIARDGAVYPLRSDHAVADLARSGLISWRSKASLVKVLPDYLRLFNRVTWGDLPAAGDADTETCAGYASRLAFSQEIADYLVDAAASALTFSTADEVSVLTLFLFLRRALGVSMFNSAEGMCFLPEGLADGTDVRFGAAVTGVERTGSRVRVAWNEPGRPEAEMEGSACVIAIPAPLVPPIYPQLPERERAYLDTVRYAPGIVGSVATGRPPGQSPALLVYPRREDRDLAVVALDHERAPGRAPEGKGLITTYWREPWTARHWETDDKQVEAEIVDRVDAIFPGTGDDVEFCHLQRWPHLASVRDAGGYRQLRRWQRSMNPRSRVVLAGDYFSTTSTESAARSGLAAARRVQALLSA